MSLSNLPSPAQLRALADWIEQMEGSAPTRSVTPIKTRKTSKRKAKQSLDDELTALAREIVRKKMF